MRYAVKIINLILAEVWAATKLNSFHLGYFPVYLSYKPCKFVFNLYCIESPFQKCKVDIAHGEKGCLDVLLPQWFVPSATGRRQRRQWGGKVEYFGCTVWWLSIITDLWWFMPWCHACFHLFPTFSANFQTFTGRRWLEALPKAECSWEHGYIVVGGSKTGWWVTQGPGTMNHRK